MCLAELSRAHNSTPSLSTTRHGDENDSPQPDADTNSVVASHLQRCAAGRIRRRQLRRLLCSGRLDGLHLPANPTNPTANSSETPCRGQAD